MLYHKIQSMYKRNPDGKMEMGVWTHPAFAFLANLAWRCTEKIDGTNIRIIVRPGCDGKGGPPVLVRYGGRTETAQLPAKLVQWLNEKFQTPEMHERLVKKFPDGGILYGEGFGAGIQKGGGNYQGLQSFILFDVRVGDWWLEWPNVIDVADTLSLPHVPIVGFQTLRESIIQVQNGIQSFFGPFPAEGIVAEPVVPMFSRNGERVIVKIKTRDFERAVGKESAETALAWGGRNCGAYSEYAPPGCTLPKGHEGDHMENLDD
jgi:hypothetical protein